VRRSLIRGWDLRLIPAGFSAAGFRDQGCLLLRPSTPRVPAATAAPVQIIGLRAMRFGLPDSKPAREARAGGPDRTHARGAEVLRSSSWPQRRQRDRLKGTIASFGRFYSLLQLLASATDSPSRPQLGKLGFRPSPESLVEALPDRRRRRRAASVVEGSRGLRLVGLEHEEAAGFMADTPLASS